jgi:predicted dehydrogenase
LKEEKLKIAVVGLGKMGILHTCILNVLPQVELSALCEKSGMTRRLLKRVFNGVRMVDDVRKLADLGLDAVYVTTPIPSHYPVVKTLYSMNVARNVFVEKTLAASYEEAKELCELADHSGGINIVGYLRRFCVTFRKARDMLSEDVVGEPSSFRAYAYSSDFLGSNYEAGTSASRGGVLRDLGCYAINLALWFFGDLRVRSVNLASSAGLSFDDSVNFEVENSGGLKGNFSVSWRMQNYRMPEAGLSITGSDGTLLVNDDKIELNLKDGRKSTMYRHDLDDNVPFWLALPEYYREDLCFIKSIQERVKVELDFRAGSKVDEIISQVEKRVGASGQQ